MYNIKILEFVSGVVVYNYGEKWMSSPIPDETKVPKKKGNPWLWRITVSIILVLAYAAFINFFYAAQGTIEGSIALGQMENDNTSYATARALITSHPLSAMAEWILIGLLLLVWLIPLMQLGQYVWKNVTDTTNQ